MRNAPECDALGQRSLLDVANANQLQEGNQQEQSDALSGAQHERDHDCLGHVARRRCDQGR